jgi:hypothetical protein
MWNISNPIMKTGGDFKALPRTGSLERTVQHEVEKQNHNYTVMHYNTFRQSH